MTRRASEPSAARSSTRCAARSVAGRSAPTRSTTRRPSTSSAAAGANDASAHVQYMMGACPNTRLVLGGYSQGAAVIDVITAVPIPASASTTRCRPTRPTSSRRSPPSAIRPPSSALPLTISPVWGRKVHRPVQRRATRSARPTARTSPRTGPRYTGGFDQPGRRLRRGPAVASHSPFTCGASIRRLTSAW